MRVRPFRAEDAPALAALFHDAVHAIGRLDYDAAQCAAWSPAPAAADHLRAAAADGRAVLVAVDATDAPLAYVDLEPDGHIDHLYRRPDVAADGAAAALYGVLEAEARARGLSRLYVEASESARRFFLKQGFSLVARRDLSVRGVPIHNYAMEKTLAGGPSPA